mmetsp:Transcript_6220/g.14678  ORF Transcript_6220/g.14678 Transcript_6220/m.14678 type:complete len:227 (+) Transcript_6220:1126-1806(+)
MASRYIPAKQSHEAYVICVPAKSRTVSKLPNTSSRLLTIRMSAPHTTWIPMSSRGNMRVRLCWLTEGRCRALDLSRTSAWWQREQRISSAWRCLAQPVPAAPCSSSQFQASETRPASFLPARYGGTSPMFRTPTPTISGCGTPWEALASLSASRKCRPRALQVCILSMFPLLGTFSLGPNDRLASLRRIPTTTLAVCRSGRSMKQQSRRALSMRALASICSRPLTA